MIVMIFQFCWLFNLISSNMTCVYTNEEARMILESREVKEVLWYPHLLEDTKNFYDYMKERHPNVKLTGIDLWRPETDFHGCGWYL